MPTNRFQFSDDFVLNNGYVGINSATPQEELDVVGVVRGDNLKVSGISSFTTYEGFLNSNHNITENTNLEAGKGITGSLSGEVIVGTGLTVTGISSAVSGQGQVDSLKVYTTLNVPVGLTTDRPIAPKPGQLFYNREFATVEFYTGDAWRQVDNRTTSGRGIYNGGNPSVDTISSTQITYINISTLGNSQYFGDATSSNWALCGGGSDGRRGVFAGGLPNAGFLNTIEYITIASAGNALDFGDLSIAAGGDSGGCVSSSTRALFARPLVRSPATAATNVIDYIEIQTLGNALDFGDLAPDNGASSDGCSSSIRGFFAGGGYPSTTKTIKVVTMSSKGDATKFGDLTTFHSYAGSVSSSTRGIFAGGLNVNSSPSYMTNSIEYITMSSQGNGTDFGSLTIGRHSPAGSCTQTRGVFAGGYISPGTTTNSNTMDYITISSFGNAIDFGDLMYKTSFLSGTSDSHGGLGGF